MDEFQLGHYKGITLDGRLDTECDLGKAIVVPERRPINSGGEAYVWHGRLVKQDITPNAYRTLGLPMIADEIIAKMDTIDYDAAAEMAASELGNLSDLSVKDMVNDALFDPKTGILGPDGEVVVRTTHLPVKQMPRSSRQRYWVGIKDPNIAAILAYGLTRGTKQAYSVIEKLGLPLDSEETKNWEEDRLLYVALQIAQGLETLHSRGILHRDIKRNNVLHHRNSNIKVKITDPGLIKVENVDGSHMTNNTIVGTPEYMAPEQTFGDPVDWRADQYGLGATMYELASGRSPLPNGENGDTVIADWSQKIQMARDRPKLPSIMTEKNRKREGLELIVGKMMDPDRKKRYQRWKEAMIDIQRVMEGKSPKYTTQKDARSSMALSGYSALCQNRRRMWGRIGKAGIMAAGIGGAYCAGLHDYLVKLLNQ